MLLDALDLPESCVVGVTYRYISEVADPAWWLLLHARCATSPAGWAALRHALLPDRHLGTCSAYVFEDKECSPPSATFPHRCRVCALPTLTVPKL